MIVHANSSLAAFREFGSAELIPGLTMSDDAYKEFVSGVKWCSDKTLAAWPGLPADLRQKINAAIVQASSWQGGQQLLAGWISQLQPLVYDVNNTQKWDQTSLICGRSATQERKFSVAMRALYSKLQAFAATNFAEPAPASAPNKPTIPNTIQISVPGATQAETSSGLKWVAIGGAALVGIVTIFLVASKVKNRKSLPA